MLKIEEQIIRHEGFRATAYTDPAGNFAIGFGRNLEGKGLSEDEALYLLRNDIDDCVLDLCKIFTYKYWSGLSEDRRNALIDMRYNLGPGGFREFREMICHIKAGDFTLAAHEMMDSKWYTQVGTRGERLRDLMLGVK